MDGGQVSASRRIRILLVDDHPAVRHGLALLLASDRMDVCAEAGERALALAHVKDQHPDLAVVDLSLDRDDGLALVADLRRRAVPVLVYSMHNDAPHVQGAFAAGALGYVTKRELDDVLVQGIREVAAGRRFVSPDAAVALAESVDTTRSGDALVKLSLQEREVYELLARGESTVDIATTMQISVRTVESYCTRILVKLGLNGMHELRRYAIDHLPKHT